jgi:hypothetical protein
LLNTLAVILFLANNILAVRKGRETSVQLK